MTNKIALVTGSTSGIGKATALLLLKHGYKIVGFQSRKELFRSRWINSYF